MRVLSVICMAVLGIYLAFLSWFIARATDASLLVGQLAAEYTQLPVPEDPLRPGYRGDPRGALGLDYQDVAIPTELGEAPGWLVGGDADAPFAAIYVHGIAGAREDGYRLLSLLHQAGVPVLLISYRNDPGAPASPDGRYHFGLTEWRDLDAAVSFMRQRGFARQVVVADSMGGAILGQFLKHSDHAGLVAGVALDAPALDLGTVIAGIAAEHWAPLTSVAVRGAGWIMPRLGYFDMAATNIADVFADYPGPLFLAHGWGDTVVPAGTSQQLAARRQGVTVLLQTGAGHLESYHEAPRRYRQAFDAFLSLLRADET